MESIAFTPMPATLRNELITEAYGDLAEAMAGCLGPDDATWCTFGQWASHAIGGYLGLPASTPGRLIARAFGHGNRQVFADVGRAHVTFLETVGRAHREGGDLDEAWQQCRRRLDVALVPVPGGALPGNGAGPTDLQGPSTPATTISGLLDLVHRTRSRRATPDRTLLIRGFAAYRHALACTSAEERSRSVLLGNALVAVHEQRLLDDTIAVGFRSWIRHALTFWTPLRTRYRWRNTRPFAAQLEIEHRWIHFATRRIIAIALPGRSIRVGCPYPTNPRVVAVTPRPLPPDLAGCGIDAIDDGELLDAVWDLFTVDGRGARCWSGLDDRLAFILAFMANEQRDPLWWRDGRLRRPAPRRHLRYRIDRLVRRVTLPPPEVEPRPPDAVPSLASHPAISDPEGMDCLRSAPTHELAPPVAAEELLDQSIRTVHDVPHDRFPWSRFDEDFRQRVQASRWLFDAGTVATSRRLFAEWTTLMYMGLLFRSLPDGYAAADGVKVLASVSDLATNPIRRVGETAHFLRDLFEDDRSWSADGLDPAGPAHESLRGVRIIHALVARQLLAAGWDSDTHGPPLNQEHVLGTMLSFVVPPFEMMTDLGIEIDGDDRDSYTRFWCGIGHLFGLPLELVTVTGADGARRSLTFDEADGLADVIRCRQQRRSLDGVRMAEALIEGVADGFPRAFDWAATGLFHVVGSDRARELLLFMEGPGRLRAEALARVLGGALRSRPTRRATRAAIELGGRYWLEPFLDEGSNKPFRRARLHRTRPLAGPLALDHLLWPTGCRSAPGPHPP